MSEVNRDYDDLNFDSYWVLSFDCYWVYCWVLKLGMIGVEGWSGGRGLI